MRDVDGVVQESESKVLWDYNCGGMFRAEVDEDGKGVFRVWRDGDLVKMDGEGEYEGEGEKVDLRMWQKEF